MEDLAVVRVNTQRLNWRLFAAFALVGLTLLTGVSGIHGQSDSDADRQRTAKTVLITGANRGLGLEFARQYGAAGWQVIGTARRPEAATDLNALEVQVMQLDVTDQESVDRLANDLENTPVDLLINNAGIFPRVGGLAEADFVAVERTLAVNTIGPMRVTRAMLPNLQRGHSKQIVSITSGLGSIADNTNGRFYGYRESKAALNMFTRSLAAELRKEGFTCIVMSPGWVQTDMGGPNATLKPAQSISGMRAVIARLTPEDTGTFWNHDGEQVPW
jgi:NAD(P)-dependent dehydrogenase (short-subunit alcohol dehydrogenase family)